jgi:hypothetical protein
VPYFDLEKSFGFHYWKVMLLTNDWLLLGSEIEYFPTETPTSQMESY